MLMAALATTFRVEATEALAQGYWMALDDLPIEAVEQAIRSAMRGCERMPTGAELRKLTGEMTGAMRAVHAWGAVAKSISQHGAYASVSFDDPVINATIRNLGGWQKLCATEDEELKWVRKDFERVYGSLCVTGVSVESTQYLAGIHEQNNCAAGHQVKAPTRIATGLPPHRDGMIRGELLAQTTQDKLIGEQAERVRLLIATAAGVVPPPAYDDEAFEYLSPDKGSSLRRGAA